MEIGNQVFMQYKRNEDGTFRNLSIKTLISAAVSRRLAAAAMGSFDVFKISLLAPIIEARGNISQKIRQ